MRYLPFMIILIGVIVFSALLPCCFTEHFEDTKTTKPAVIKPATVIKPAIVTKPVVIKPVVIKPVVTKPKLVKPSAYQRPNKPDITSHTLSCTVKPGELRHQLNRIKEGSCQKCINEYKQEMEEYGQDLTIPLVFKREGEYYVYIYKDSPYHNQFGYYGKRSYGSNRRLARELFMENFPNIPVPDILRFDGNPDESARNCPFILRDGNPCSSNACSSVDWSQGDISKQNLTTDCKWNISSYCTKNSRKDPMCQCWDTDGEYYNTKFCRKFRKHFETQNDYKCKIGMFDVTTHPDMKDYIKRDKIPCWNCDLDKPAESLKRKWVS